MDRRVVPFRSWHYEWLLAKRATPDPRVTLTDRLLTRLEAANSWTGVVDGDPVAVAGTLLQWPGRHLAWAYLGDDTGPHMTWLTLATRRVLRGVEGRVELTVRCDFAAGHRWAKLLGFEVEAPLMKHYGPQHEPHTLYARVN